MTLIERLREDRRLGALLLLEAAGRVGLREDMLLSALRDTGRRVSADMLRADLAWLDEQGLAWWRECEDGHVAAVTDRGRDVALGHAAAPGVRRPE